MTTTTTTQKQARAARVLARRLAREANARAKRLRVLRAALAASEQAEGEALTQAAAWRHGAASGRILRLLRLVEAGLPEPEPRAVAARRRAYQGLAALAAIGAVVAKALTEQARRVKRRVADALRRAACKARKALRLALRRVVGAVTRRALVATPVLPRRPVVAALLALTGRAFVFVPVLLAPPTVATLATGPPSDPLATLLARHPLTLNHHHHAV